MAHAPSVVQKAIQFVKTEAAVRPTRLRALNRTSVHLETDGCPSKGAPNLGPVISFKSVERTRERDRELKERRLGRVKGDQKAQKREHSVLAVQSMLSYLSPRPPASFHKLAVSYKAVNLQPQHQHY